MSIDHIVTPLDSAVLDSKKQYVFYHRMVDFALKEIIVAVDHNQLCSKLELGFFKQYCDLLLYSIEAMRIKYMYDKEDNMKVDLTKSGFPNYLEFRYLFNDLALRENYLSKLKDIDQLKSEFLDTLLRKKLPIDRDRLFQAASILYYTTVEQKYIYNRFVQGKIVKSDKPNLAQFMTSWSFYDVILNRPFICFMYFNYAGNDIEDYRPNIYNVLKSTADRKMPMDTMAYGIDRKLEPLMPKLIKRIDLGPLHNIFTKDESLITHAILESLSKKEINLSAYAFSMKMDEVSSGSEFSEGGFFTKQVLQRWNKVIKKTYLFAPHRIIQLLYNKVPELMDEYSVPPIEVAPLNFNPDH